MARPSFAAAFRIAADTTIYRLRKREAANLATSLSLAVAIGLGPGDVAVRLAFGALLNLFVYLVNDCFDVRLDLEAPGRDHGRTRFLAENLGTGWAVSAVLALASMAIGAAHGRGLLVTAVVNAIVIVAYSGWWKRLPFADVLAMGVWGVSMAMVGFPLDSRRGWMLAGLLGCLSMVTETVQVLRDEASDRAAGLRTTAVVLGPGNTARLARALVGLAAVYAFAVVGPAPGAVLALALFVPIRADAAERSWDMLRAVFGTAWLVALAAEMLRARGMI